MTPLAHDIVIPRGGRFEAVAVVLRDQDDQPLRTTAGVEVSAPVKAWRGASDVLAHLPCSARLVTFAGEYGDQPVAVAQLDEMTAAQTAALTFERGYWSMLVSGEHVGGGRVAAPRVGP